MYTNVHHITAGAGAGKTTRIVEIITGLVNGGADPQRMILTTFTDAAATELREQSKAKLSTDNAVKMNGALMGTLHSIASRYIKRYWYLLDISPSVKPVGESVSGILMNRSLEVLVTGEQKALLNKYVETFGVTNRAEGGYDYDFWKDTLNILFGKMRGYGFDKERIPEFRDRTMKILRDTFNQDGNLPLFDRVRPDLEKYLGYDTISKLFTDPGQKQFDIDCAQIRKILAIDPFTVEKRQLEEIGAMKWGSVAKIAKKGPDKDRFDPELDAAKGAVKTAADQLSQGMVPVEYSMIFQVAELLFDIMGAWMDSYEKIKKETGVIDFTDMEKLFLLLLGKDEVREDIRASVDYLFVDEFQDSNPIQAKIYELLSTLIKQSWFVGDRKQAIYGFAGSDAGLIAELVKSFPKQEKDETSPTGFKKDKNGNSFEVLDTSRRSTTKLVNAANEIFIEAFHETTGNPKDVIEEEHVRLKADPKKVDTAWDPLYHIDVCPSGRKQSLDVDALANFVCALAGDPLFVKNYRLDDIAILTRVGSQATKIGKALAKKGIPTSYVDPKGFKETPEVSLVMAVLRLSEGIDTYKSRAEIRKLVLDEKLAKLSERVGKKKNNLDDFPGLEDFVKALRPHSVMDRINEIITRFDLVGISGQWGNPDARRGSLNLLRKAAEDYASKSATLCVEADVRGFLSFLKDCKVDQKFDNSTYGVKVLTYHKSKGLGWKIVILCGLDDYKEEETISGVSIRGSSMHPDGILVIPRLPDKEWVRKCIQKNPESKKALDERRAEKMGEEKRLLYVGFTRAKEVVITAAMSTSPGVIETLCPTARKRADKAPTDATHVDIWGVPGLVSRYGNFTDEPALTAPGVSAPQRYKEAGFLLPAHPIYETVKYRSPSKYKDKAVQTLTDVEDAKDLVVRMDIPHAHLDHNVFGDCIHHIFARCAPDKHDENLAVAASTLRGYGIPDADAPRKVVDCIEAFFAWMAKAYGNSTSLEQEVPFQYTDAKGQVFSGNMDLVWRTEKGCVLADYKTSSGSRSELFKEGEEHWAGKYASQLGVYFDALSTTSWGEPRDRLLFYPEEGVVIRLKKKA